MLGDFNDILEVGSVSNTNMQGVLLQEMLGRCELSAVPKGVLASGPGYIYCNGAVKTTVNYILMDVKAASMMTSCRMKDPMKDLNTSDHLPLTVSLPIRCLFEQVF